MARHVKKITCTSFRHGSCSGCLEGLEGTRYVYVLLNSIALVMCFLGRGLRVLRFKMISLGPVTELFEHVDPWLDTVSQLRSSCSSPCMFKHKFIQLNRQKGTPIYAQIFEWGKIHFNITWHHPRWQRRLRRRWWWKGRAWHEALCRKSPRQGGDAWLSMVFSMVFP